jgi:hypothetical protein
MLSLGLAGCDFKATLTTYQDDQGKAAAAAATERLKFFIRGKKTSNLDEARKSITLSIDAVDPDGGDVSVEWSQDPTFGNFNTTRGKDVQWTVNREGTFNVIVTATVRGSLKKDDPDVAHFTIPVQVGKIKATEIAPEITLSPQSVALFRPLPTGVPLTSDQLDQLGVKTRAQLTATTYTYDSASNQKVKKSGDFNEIKWLSGDANLVVVDDNGYAKPADGSTVGMTVVTASSKTNSASQAASLVTVQYLDTKISLSYPTTTIYLQNKGTPNDVTIKSSIQYTNPLDRDRIVYTDSTGRDVSWSSSNPSLAQVDANGKVSPLADAATGDVIITATSNYDPSKNNSVTLKVREQSASSVNFIAE